MLSAIRYRMNIAMEQLGGEVYLPADTPDPDLYSRVQLFAPRKVRLAWHEAREVLDARIDEGSDFPPERRRSLIALTYTEVVEQLLAEMRVDLGVPQNPGPIRRRFERRAHREGREATRAVLWRRSP